MSFLQIKKLSYLLFFILSLTACSGQYDRVPEDQFVGQWELKGRTMFDGMIVEIAKNENGKLQGRVKKLNDNQYVKMYMHEGDLWVAGISRSSNFRFKMTEKKIAKELFGEYGMSTSVEFNAEFINDDKIGISRNDKPADSSMIYERIK